MIIDRAVGSHGHKKDAVDGLNAVDNQYLKNICFEVSIQRQNIKKNHINAHIATLTVATSLLPWIIKG